MRYRIQEKTAVLATLWPMRNAMEYNDFVRRWDLKKLGFYKVSPWRVESDSLLYRDTEE